MSDPSKSPKTAFQPPPTLIPTPAGGAPSLIPGDSQGVDNDVTDHLKVQLLVRAYQVRGHHKAKIDPLGIKSGVDFDYRTAYPPQPTSPISQRLIIIVRNFH